jgi:hypothetical protein
MNARATSLKVKENCGLMVVVRATQDNFAVALEN